MWINLLFTQTKLQTIVVSLFDFRIIRERSEQQDNTLCCLSNLGDCLRLQIRETKFLLHLGSFEHPVDALRSEPRNKKARNLREVSKKTFSKQQIL